MDYPILSYEDNFGRKRESTGRLERPAMNSHRAGEQLHLAAWWS